MRVECNNKERERERENGRESLHVTYRQETRKRVSPQKLTELITRLHLRFQNQSGTNLSHKINTCNKREFIIRGVYMDIYYLNVLSNPITIDNVLKNK